VRRRLIGCGGCRCAGPVGLCAGNGPAGRRRGGGPVGRSRGDPVGGPWSTTGPESSGDGWLGGTGRSWC